MREAAVPGYVTLARQLAQLFNAVVLLNKRILMTILAAGPCLRRTQMNLYSANRAAQLIKRGAHIIKYLRGNA